MVRQLARITINFPEMGRSVKADSGDNLLAVMRENGIAIAADCGGVGNCGRCRVIVDGKAQRACLTHLLHDAEVEIPAVRFESEFEILTDSGSAERLAGSEHRSAHQSEHQFEVKQSTRRGYAIAVDIGTTTLVGKLIDLTDGKELGSFAELNSQRMYGFDVISRINAALDDASALSQLITSQIDSLVVSLLLRQRVSNEQVTSVVIAGNTTMSYLLLGLPCRSLGMAPFAPEFELAPLYSWEDVFHTRTLNCPCQILPCISAFIGGDLTAGLYLLRDHDDFILMDMGTNGEILFKRGDRLLCTATAAGPAFEGGCIECGSGSVRGAVSAVRFVDGEFVVKTIGDAPATSICGSGILDLMAVLVREGFIDHTGCMAEKAPGGRVVLSKDDGSVYFTQKDVRQFQLAKSAVRCGVEIVLREMGGDLPGSVFLAGGFGQNLDPESAITTGLLPEIFRGRIHAIGNSSLSGAVKVCLNESLRDEMTAYIKGSQEINLATHRLFGDLFMEHMAF